MFHLTELTYRYPGDEAALTGVNLTISRGEFVLFAGANGSGKSTLLGMVAGLLKPDAGTITVDGEDSPKRLRSLARLVMQDADLQILGGTVGEDLLLGREASAGAEGRAREMAERLGLMAHWDRPVQTLSWGMKRKLCLAAALLDEPAALLLDEPFSGLDYPSSREMRSFLAERRNDGMTLMVAVHDLEPVIDMADRVAVLNRGRLVLDAPPERVLPHVAKHSVRPPCAWTRTGETAPWEHD